MKKRTKVVLIFGVIGIAFILSVLISVLVLTPKADKIELDGGAESYFVSETTYVDYQDGDDCSAYAAAYVLRCLGADITGKELYSQMKRFFGLMTVRGVCTAIEKQGYSAKAYYGNTETLKQRLQQGRPIICFIKNGKDTHYVVAVGYDESYVYIVDSIKENANVTDSNLYNRKISINDFESLWHNDIYLVNNVYVVVE